MGSCIRTRGATRLTQHRDVDVFLRVTKDRADRLVAVFHHSAHTMARCPQAAWRPEFQRTRSAVENALRELADARDPEYASLQRAELEKALAEMPASAPAPRQRGWGVLANA